MKIDWIALGVPAFAGALLLILAKYWADQRNWPTWAVVLPDGARAIVDWLRLHSGMHLRTLDRTLRVAREDHEEGQVPRARRVLDEADALAERHVRFGLRRLERWHDLALSLGNLRPLPPLPARALKLPPLRRLARLQRLVAYVASDRARFMLGLHVQRAALHMVGWLFAAAVARARRENGLPQALEDMQTGHDELAALDAQALATLGCLLASLPPELPGPPAERKETDPGPK